MAKWHFHLPLQGQWLRIIPPLLLSAAKAQAALPPFAAAACMMPCPPAVRGLRQSMAPAPVCWRGGHGVSLVHGQQGASRADLGFVRLSLTPHRAGGRAGRMRGRAVRRAMHFTTLSYQVALSHCIGFRASAQSCCEAAQLPAPMLRKAVASRFAPLPLSCMLSILASAAGSWFSRCPVAGLGHVAGGRMQSERAWLFGWVWCHIGWQASASWCTLPVPIWPPRDLFTLPCVRCLALGFGTSVPAPLIGLAGRLGSCCRLPACAAGARKA